jgi:hypothetical protein
MKSVTGTGRVRCAIYTRVSTDQGLDQDFNSLDAQYEAASAYIKSQAHAWCRDRHDKLTLAVRVNGGAGRPDRGRPL